MSWEWTLRLCALLWGAFIPLAESAPSPILPILCYHRIAAHPQSEYDVSREDFLAQMQYLRERGYGAFDQKVEEMARDVGFTLVLIACPGVNTTKTHPLRLKRQIIYRDDGLAGFSRKLSAPLLGVRFPFQEGEILDRLPQRIDIDLLPNDPSWGPPILTLDRRQVDAAYDPEARRISLVRSPPLPRGIHILESRMGQEESGRWHQNSSLFVIRSHHSGHAGRD